MTTAIGRAPINSAAKEIVMDDEQGDPLMDAVARIHRAFLDAHPECGGLKLTLYHADGSLWKTYRMSPTRAPNEPPPRADVVVPIQRHLDAAEAIPPDAFKLMFRTLLADARDLGPDAVEAVGRWWQTEQVRKMRYDANMVADDTAECFLMVRAALDLARSPASRLRVISRNLN